MASPAQLAHVGLPGRFFLWGGGGRDGDGDGEPSPLADAAVWRPCRCAQQPVAEVSAALLREHEAAHARGGGGDSHLARQFLSVGRPFVVRQWAQSLANASDAADVGVGMDARGLPAAAVIATTTTADGSRGGRLQPLVASGYMPRRAFLRQFGALRVQAGGIPYADTYAFEGAAGGSGEDPPLQVKVALSAFMKQHMPRGSGRSPPAAPPPPPPSLRPQYVFDGQVLVRNASAFAAVAALLPQGLGPAAGSGHLSQLIVGGALSGAMPHFHGTAFNLLLVGVKLWVLVPPSHAEFVQQHAADWFGRVYPRRYCGCGAGCAGIGREKDEEAAAEEGPEAAPAAGIPHLVLLQGPGDLVLVPEHWGHAVLNLADTVAVAYE